MARRRALSGAFRAPFLRSLRLLPERAGTGHPFDIPALRDLDLVFDRPVTVLAGPNGSGKSTLTEAIAALCGFGRHGGTANYAAADDVPLAAALRAAWLPKMSRGFFLRAETLMGFIGEVNAIAVDAPEHHLAYGGRPLDTRSHGEGCLVLFRRRLSASGVFVLDEPEAALSPFHQVELLRIMRATEERGDAQIIVATHSPLLMAYPGATLLHLEPGGIIERPFTTTDHFRLLRGFYADPDAFMAGVFAEEGGGPGSAGPPPGGDPPIS